MSKPLAYDFPNTSPTSRAPFEVPLNKRIAEVRRELDQRRRHYPQFVIRGRMTELEADLETRMMATVLEDLEALQRREETGIWAMPGMGDQVPEPIAVHEAWERKIRSLRREIQIRRNTYPRKVEQGRMTADDARKWLERLEAVHWMYWIDCFCMVPPPPRDVPDEERRAAISAGLAIVRAHVAQLEKPAAAAA